MADSKMEDSKIKTEDIKIEDSKMEDSKMEDSKMEDSKMEESKMEDSKMEDSKMEDSKMEDSKMEDSKMEDSKMEDSKIKMEDSEIKMEDIKMEDSKIKMEDSKMEDASMKKEQKEKKQEKPNPVNDKDKEKKQEKPNPVNDKDKEKKQEKPNPVNDKDKKKKQEEADEVPLEDLDSEFGHSDDESANRLRPDKRPPISQWAKTIIEEYSQKYLQTMVDQLHCPTPDFTKIETVLEAINTKIRSQNDRHNVPVNQNTIQKDMYRLSYYGFINWVEFDKGNVRNKASLQEKWDAFFKVRGTFYRFNHQNYLPQEWNIPVSLAEREWGPLPPGVKEPSYDDDDDDDYADSAATNSSEEESDGEEAEGLDALEGRMRKEYASLSRGKVLYWWTVGTGTQIFVQYGSKKSPIYRVRAGSSMPWDPRTAEQVLSRTPGNAKVIYKSPTGERVEKWKYSRQHVLDILGVGWKVEGDDDASGNSLALIRPVKDALYPHTRVLVKWKDNNKVSLERRGFVRRIANGNSINGDRMIYLKAKELENAYWGYDVEARDEESSEDEISLSDESDHPQTRSRRKEKSQRRTRSAKKDISSSESEDSEESDIEAEKEKRQARWLRQKKGKARSKKDPESDEDIRRLEKQIQRLKLKKSASSGRTRRRRA
ncbi:hypothetical protein BDW69DRAFT_189013 [Aspergillus filifer]